MNKTKKYIVLDCETCNTVNQPIPYDVGWVVCDRLGRIYERRSYVIAEVFFDMADVMQTAYYAEKIPKYYEDIKSGSRKVATMWTIRHQLLEDMKAYKTKQVGAYNMAFDKRALNNLIRYVSKSWKRWFFPFGTEFFCIWHCCCDLILSRKSYIDFAIDNNFVSNANNILTNAECAYRYITNNIDFKEEHTGLADCEIEVALLAYCFKQHKKMITNINPSCWRIVQRKRKELEFRQILKSA